MLAPAIPPSQPEIAASGLIAPASVDLGTIRAGETARAELRIANRAAKPVRIARFEVSCPCVRIHPAMIEVPAGGEATATIAIDTSEERGFHGDLATPLDALSTDSAVLFRTIAALRVSSSCGSRVER